MLRAFVDWAKTVLPALTSAQWWYQRSIYRPIYDCKLRNEKKVYSKCAINFYRPHLYQWHNWQLKNKEAL
jgi:hypothetical protein